MKNSSCYLNGVGYKVGRKFVTLTKIGGGVVRKIKKTDDMMKKMVRCANDASRILLLVTEY